MSYTKSGKYSGLKVHAKKESATSCIDNPKVGLPAMNSSLSVSQDTIYPTPPVYLW